MNHAAPGVAVNERVAEVTPEIIMSPLDYSLVILPWLSMLHELRQPSWIETKS